MKKMGWKAIPVLLFVLLCIFLFRGLFLEPHTLPSVQIGKTIPSFQTTQLEHPDLIFQSDELSNQVVLLNVWASWCAACVEEQVFLMELARQSVPIYGLNYKDQPHDALSWLKQWGNPYQKIGQDIDGKIAIDLGVYGAPETFVIDKHGRIRYRHAGIMTNEVWKETIQPLMKQLEAAS